MNKFIYLSLFIFYSAYSFSQSNCSNPLHVDLCPSITLYHQTNAGMIDPLGDCAEIARSNSLWYHVDAAWGGALIASNTLRGTLKGIEQADSITIDAHKWFATTMGCGMFLTRHTDLLSSAFHVSTGFMPSNLPKFDPYVTTVQWSSQMS